MARRARRRIPVEDQKSDMTPMIDCVFQLIIFFVLVIDIQQKSFEQLRLPEARFAQPDVAVPEGRPIVNILQNGTVVHERKEYWRPADGDDYRAVHDLLRRLARDASRPDSASRPDGNARGGAAITPELPLLIRADVWTDFTHVARLMDACRRNDVRFWKLELALAEKKERREEPR